MKRFWDGLKSFLAAIAIGAICLVPAWYAHVAISYSVAPSWVYGFVIALVMGAGLVSVDFLKKAFSGIAPTRTRRRS